MTKAKSTKRALLMSVLSMLLCLSMLVGSTFAWFTDTVTSGNNRIVAGNLSVDLVHVGGGENGEDVSIKEDPDHRIFDYDKWEPGYTALATLKVENKGTLALKYKLNVLIKDETQNETATLADVIDVYVYYGSDYTKPASFADITAEGSGWQKAGTLATFMADPTKTMASGDLLPAGKKPKKDGEAVGSVQMTVALHMQELAGNEYQGLSLGDLSLTLSADQYTYEEDSFDDQYDRFVALIQEGYVEVKTEADFAAAMENGEKIVLSDDIKLTQTLSLQNASFILDGNGHTITQADDCTNTYALFDITGGSATIKNVTFDGIQEGAIVRTVYADLDMDKVTVENCQHTQIEGLLRLLGKSTITNSTFKNNDCKMVVTLNFDFNDKDINDPTNTAPQVVKNCVFEGNTCKETAVLHYVNGASATIDGNKFLNNTVTSTGNAATVYMGFTENNVITNNVFSGNKVTTTHATTVRATGGLMIGYEATITGNAFVGNTVTAAGRQLGNDVYVSVLYTDMDLSGNYWGGNAPVENDDYFVEHSGHEVIISDYLTTYGN